MLKLIAGLALLAGLLVLGVALTMPESGGPGVAMRPGARTVSWLPDLRSFSAGLLLGLFVAWVRAFPWRQLPQVLIYWTRVWQRRIALLGFGGLFIGILLYY